MQSDLRGRREDRRRTGDARFAWVPHVRQSLVAAGVPVSVQRSTNPTGCRATCSSNAQGDLPRVGIAAGIAEGFVEKPKLPFTGVDGSPWLTATPILSGLVGSGRRGARGAGRRRRRHRAETPAGQEIVRRENSSRSGLAESIRMRLISSARTRSATSAPSSTGSSGRAHRTGRSDRRARHAEPRHRQTGVRSGQDWSGQIQ